MVGRVGSFAKRVLKSFCDDQMTHHAAALTYYGLMSLFPALLLGISVLGLVGQYPATYEALLSYLRDVVPSSMLEAVDASVRGALRSTGSAVTALLVGIVAAFYGTTGALEAARRALNVSYETREQRGFVRRKATDVGSTVVLSRSQSGGAVVGWACAGLGRQTSSRRRAARRGLAIAEPGRGCRRPARSCGPMWPRPTGR